MTRKHCRRKVYPLSNPIRVAMEGAAITPDNLLDQLRLQELSAIDSFTRGRATKADWMAIADLCNIAETMARDGIGPEVLEPCDAAQAALGAAHQRLQTHGKLGMSGPELVAIREIAEYHHLQRTAVARSVYETAIKKTGDRIRSAHPDLKVFA